MGMIRQCRGCGGDVRPYDNMGGADPTCEACVGKMRAALEVAIVCMASTDPEDYLAVFTAEELKGMLDRTAARTNGEDFPVEACMREAWVASGGGR